MTALDNLATALAEKGETDKEKLIQAIRQREQQRRTAKKIKYLQGKLRSGSTTMVTMLDSSGNHLTHRFISLLKDEFRFKGLTTAAQATLAGLYESNLDIDEKILNVIAQWQMPQAVCDLGPIKMDLTIDQYTSFWKKAKEDTSCFPSALSFSTMKAGSQDPSIALLDCSMTRIP
jgi:hypothetical protein